MYVILHCMYLRHSQPPCSSSAMNFRSACCDTHLIEDLTPGGSPTMWSLSLGCVHVASVFCRALEPLSVSGAAQGQVPLVGGFDLHIEAVCDGKDVSSSPGPVFQPSFPPSQQTGQASPLQPTMHCPPGRHFVCKSQTPASLSQNIEHFSDTHS